MRLDVVSESAKLRMTSRNDGIEPVVIAFNRGIVMVGDVAWAVNGIPEPPRIRLIYGISNALDFKTKQKHL